MGGIWYPGKADKVKMRFLPAGKNFYVRIIQDGQKGQKGCGKYLHGYSGEYTFWQRL
jgi:hypothetical protein